MEFKALAIKGLIEIQPKIWEDERGYFFESYNEEEFRENQIKIGFLQDNQSFSYKNVVRGLHFQRVPYAQGKLVRVVSGRVYDVAVDIRPGSPTYGKHVGVVLDAALQNMLYIPEGFAHGFAALEDSVFSYKCTNIYNKTAEGGIRYDDKVLSIDWQVSEPMVSDKDLALASFSKLAASSLVW